MQFLFILFIFFFFFFKVIGFKRFSKMKLFNSNKKKKKNNKKKKYSRKIRTKSLYMSCPDKKTFYFVMISSALIFFALESRFFYYG